MPHLQLPGVRVQGVVDPRAEKRCLHGATPRLHLFLCPFRESSSIGRQLAFLHNLAGNRFDAVADTFLVDVESDIVNDIHGVLLYEYFEPALGSRAQDNNLWENPSS